MNHILIAEDEEAHLELIREAFEGYADQFQLIFATSLEEAKRSIEERVPDLVITDNWLPDGEGREIVQMAEWRFPVILMTAHGDEALAAQTIKEGIQDYVVKTPDTFRKFPDTVTHALREWNLRLEQKRTDEALRESEEKFRNLFNNTNDSIVLHRISSNGEAGKFLEVNEVACQVSKYSREELLDRTPMDLEIPQNSANYTGILNQLYSKGKAFFETTVVTKNGNQIPVEVNAHLIDYKGQKALLGVVRDVTAQKQYQQHIEHLNSLLYAIRTINQLVVQEDNLEKMLEGASKAMIQTMDYAGCMIAMWNNEVQKIVPFIQAGKYQFVKAFAISPEGEGKAPDCVKEVVKQQKMQVIDDVSTCSPCVFAGEYRPTDYTVMVVPMIRNAEVLGILFIARVQQSSKMEDETNLLQEVADDLAFAHEKLLAEDALRTSEDKYRTLFMAEADPVFMIDTQSGHILDANPAAEQLYGYNREELLAMRLEELSVESDLSDHNNQIHDNRFVTLPERIHQCKDGSRITVEVSARHFKRQGRLIDISVIRDITERKRAENALYESQQQLKHLNLILQSLSNINELIMHEKDGEQLIQKGCEELTRTRGYSSAWIALTNGQRIIGSTMSPYVTGQTQVVNKPLSEETIPQCVIDALSQEHVYVIPDMERYCKQCLFSGMDKGSKGLSLRLEYNKKIYGVLTVTLPHEIAITGEEEQIFKRMGQNLAFALFNLEMEEEKNKARHDIQVSEQKFRNFFNNTNDGILITDFDRNFLEINQTALDLIGYSRKEVETMTVDDFINPEFAGKLEERLDLLRKDKIVPNTELTLIKKDGSHLPIEISSKVIHYFNNEQVILSVARDITKRKELEQRVLDSMIEAEDRERNRISADLHDEIGPYLSTIKLYVNELRKAQDFNYRKELHEKLNTMLDQSVSKIKDISNNLMPSVLTDYGLMKAVETFVANINTNTGLKINLDIGNVHQRYQQKLEINMYRIVTELMNNTLKHSQADQINIIFEEQEDTFYLTYTENGQGFDFQIQLADKEGLGLQNIRNRLLALNGEHQAYYDPEKGMILTFKIKEIHKYYA